MIETYDFEAIYETIIGQRVPEAEVSCAENISVDGTVYSDAWQELLDARSNLICRFSMDEEDRDLEQIMNALSRIEREAAYAMYRAVVKIYCDLREKTAI